MSNPNRSGDKGDKHDVPRRGFFSKAAAITFAAIVGLVPALGALGFLFSPLVKRDGGIVGGKEGFLPLNIGPNALPADGTPQSFKIVADMVDAWNFYPQQDVGSVWLRKKEDGKILAFNTICPHLGCSVDYRGAQNDFFCPCHFSGFSLDGEKQNSIPPRDMDGLQTKIIDGKLWVEYKNYRGGIEEQVEV